MSLNRADGPGSMSEWLTRDMGSHRQSVVGYSRADTGEEECNHATLEVFPIGCLQGLGSKVNL